VHVISHRFVDGGSSTSPTFKLRHPNLYWIISWGIKTMILLRYKGVLGSPNWLVGVKTHNHRCKTLHAYCRIEVTWVYQKTKLWNKLSKQVLNEVHWSPPPMLSMRLTIRLNEQYMDGMKYTLSRCEVQGPIPLHTLSMLHVWMGIVWKFVQTPSGSAFYIY
jgi:hypothetical protein